jgi:hypothetical protein
MGQVRGIWVTIPRDEFFWNVCQNHSQRLTARGADWSRMRNDRDEKASAWDERTMVARRVGRNSTFVLPAAEVEAADYRRSLS